MFSQCQRFFVREHFLVPHSRFFRLNSYLFGAPEAHFGGRVGGLGRTLGLFGQAVQPFWTSRGYQWHDTWVLRGLWNRGVGETAENGRPKGRPGGGANATYRAKGFSLQLTD